MKNYKTSRPLRHKNQKMKKKRISFHEVRFLFIINLAFLIASCNAQENKNDTRSTILKNETISQNLNLNNKTTKEQISQVVRMMFQDSKGQIWFGAQGGAFKLSNNSLIHVDNIKSEIGKGVTVKDIAEDAYGNIWIGHTDGISKVDGEKVTNYYESDGLLSNDVWNLEVDSKNNVWIGTIDGVCIYNGQTFMNFELPEGEIDTTLGISSKKMIHCILEDSNEEIWFCTNAGLFKYAEDMLTNVSEKVGIQTNFVNKIIERKNGEFLVSTKDALYKMKGDDAINITNEIPEVGKGVGSVAEDKDEKIWFVFNQHQLYTFDNNKIIEFIKTEDNKGPVIFQIFEDQNDRLWFVGYGGAYRLENGEFINITKDGPW